MTCPARLPGPSALPCQRTDPHLPYEGFVYETPLDGDTRHADGPEDH